MLTENDIKRICEDLMPFHKHFELEDLLSVARPAAKEAEENYQKLVKPSCSLSVYQEYWVTYMILANPENKFNLTRKVGKNEEYEKAWKKYLDSVDKYFRTGLDVDQIVELWEKIEEEVPSVSEGKLLSEFESKFKELEPLFVQMRKAQQKMAVNLGFESQLEVFLYDMRISQDDYNFFLENKDNVIKYCQEQLSKLDLNLPTWFYSQFNPLYHHDFLSLVKDYPEISFPEGVTDFVEKSFPVIGKVRDKLVIELVEGGSSFNYLVKKDQYRMGIDRSGDNIHRVRSLFHEFGHAISELENFENGLVTLGKGLDLAEYLAYINEFELLNKFSSTVYRARMGDFLVLMAKVLFDIEVLKNPEQDLAKLHANIFNYCFPDAKQTKNYTYLIKYGTVYRPLGGLPQAMGMVKALSERGNLSRLK